MKIELDKWSSEAWVYLHAVTFHYPTNPTELQKREMMQFFTLVGTTLPCENCSIHFEKMLNDANDPINVESGPLLREWLWRAHNKVNARIGKKQHSYHALYNQMTGEVSKKASNKRWIIIVLIGLFFIFGLVIYSNMKKIEVCKNKSK